MRSYYLILLLCFQVSAMVKFTNLKCENLDHSFSKFVHCRLQAVNRTTSYVSIRAKLWKVPVTDCTIFLQTFRRANGYKPFLYKFMANGCKFFRQKARNALFQFCYGFIEPFSNLNHTCPYDHDIILEKLPNTFIDNRLTNMLPVPRGDYYLNTTWFAYNIPRAIITVYITLS